jgi:competence protein CoiA
MEKKAKSDEHSAVQEALLSTIGAQKCELEKPFPSLRRIADVVWEEEKLLFEIQCSPLRMEEFLSRCLDYRAAGYQIVWIFHVKCFTKIPFPLVDWPHYFTDMSFNGKGQIFDRIGENGPALPIQLQKPFNYPPAHRLHPILQRRADVWQRGFRGDAVNIYLRNPTELSHLPKEPLPLRLWRALCNLQRR